jgi:DNA-binding Lrp family transcriptional regulator
VGTLERDRKVFNELKERGRRSLRKIGVACKLSKDAVRRALQALSGRNRHPESELLETEAGWGFACRLIIAAIFVFGLKSNVGASRLSEFFHLVRLEKRAGVSPTALRNIMMRMEDAVLRYGEKQEAGREGKPLREIIAGGDETFFNEMAILVMMDLSSGYIVTEESAPDRTDVTWNEKAQRRLKLLGLKVRHFVSDRGKSLVKLALDGLGCRAGADLFHAQYDVSKWLGAGFFGKIKKAAKSVKNAALKLAAAEEKGAGQEKITACERTLKQAQEQQDKLERGRERYLKAQREASAAVHPFSNRGGGAQTADETKKRLEEQARRFEEIGRIHNIPDRSGRRDKFRKQIRDIA